MSKRVYIILLLTLSLLFSLIVTSITLAQNDIPDKVLEAAELGITSFRIRDAAILGFELEPEDKLTLGQGFEISCVDKNKLDHKKKKSLLDVTTVFKESWNFTIDQNGEPLTFMSIGKDRGGNYTVTSMGGDAKDFGISLKKIKKETDDVKLVVGGFNYFFIGKKDGKEIIISSIPSGKGEALDNSKFRTTDEVVKHFQKLVDSSKSDRYAGGIGGSVSASKSKDKGFKMNKLHIMTIAVGILIIIALTITLLRRKLSRA